MKPALPQRRRPQWAIGEQGRAGVSAVTASLLTTATILALVLAGVAAVREHAFAVGVILTWSLFAVVHSVLTAWVFLGAGTDDLADLLRRSRGKRLKQDTVDDAPGWSVQLSLMSIVVVVLLVAIPALRGQLFVLLLGLVMVVAVWINTVLMYAVHYARMALHAEAGGEAVFEFPGHAERGFSDYLYIAGIVQSTFGPPDVTVLTSPARRTLLHHSLIAFVFNTGIVAVLISILLATNTGA